MSSTRFLLALIALTLVTVVCIVASTLYFAGA